jgi:GrpB-like predicted nucleotidyltransferase (UPF0157 family)
MTAPVVVVDYDPRWPDDFAVIRKHLGPNLPEKFGIEHIGSTAVPGLAAKPIIDVDVVVATPGDVRRAIASLVTLGYQHRGDLGIPGREAFDVLPGLPYHHLYVVVAGSGPYRDHLELRDFLRTHPGEAARYAAVKRRLAHLLATDREAYVLNKAFVVEDLLAAARGADSSASRSRAARSGLG